MNKLLVIFAFTALLSCHSEKAEKFAAISNFNLRPGVLKSSDEVKLIYCSRLGDRNDPVRYLIQLVAIKVETGDTVNILTVRTDDLRQNDGESIFSFKAYDDELLMALVSESKEMKKIIDNDSVKLDEFTYSRINHLLMVVQDPRFKEIEENKFPTVIGQVVR